jgi:predicted acetyltransferase
MEFTYAKSRKDLEDIADMMGKIFRRKNWFEFYKMRMDYQTRAPYFKPEHSRIAKENGQIMGHTSIIEKYIRIDDCVVKVAGIGDVYTHPDARGRHVAAHLMNDAMDYMRKNQYPLTMLYGIPNFYHKFGYSEAMADYKVFVPVKHVAQISSSAPLRPSKDSDIPELNRLYNETYKSKTGYMRRVPASWYNIAIPEELFVTTDSGDKPTGYLVYRAVWGSGGYVAEAVAPTEEIRRAILAFYISKARETYQAELEFRMTPDDPFARFLQDFGSRVVARFFAEGEGNAMLGIIDLPLLLKEIKPCLEKRLVYSPLREIKGGVNIVTDMAGKAAVLFDQGKIKIQGKIQKGLPTLETSQTLLTRSIIGYWSSERLMERVKSAGFKLPPELSPILVALFPEKTPFTSEPDYF